MTERFTGHSGRHGEEEEARPEPWTPPYDQRVADDELLMSADMALAPGPPEAYQAPGPLTVRRTPVDRLPPLDGYVDREEEDE